MCGDIDHSTLPDLKPWKLGPEAVEFTLELLGTFLIVARDHFGMELGYLLGQQGHIAPGCQRDDPKAAEMLYNI
jgi:hypothetical protein